MKTSKRATKAKADPQSKTSKKRANRGFESLEKSCRIHRRALNRQLASRTIDKKLVDPGQKVKIGTDAEFTGGGAIKFW